ncbi:hypothetical protein O2W15_09455 [Modestobacter sp. VKM Ac-2979]|uniref:hypothetical protein n=1 Tax=unclassified Modestobacter TaxID=2643866 RepID=UPI0022AB9041|nr:MULTISPECIES: hypothetical protein [unclassified Modestobacter]MCZ2811661.1 hypothetical protein [Modestobacter sp. VKM Ac-2979]MCZ2843384.1 hypothetical protein [Modestobacter sp. VKM Ac-2980]
MRARTTTSAATGRRRPPAGIRRPGLYLGIAAAGAVLVNVVVGVGPAAQADPVASQPVSVAEQLGLAAESGAVDGTEDLRPLEELAASRATREAEQTAAQQAQAAADQAVLDQQAAEAEAARLAAEAAAAAEAEAARVAAEAAAAAEAEAQAAAAAPARAAAAAKPSAAAAASPGTAVSAIAKINNSAGPIKPQAQAAANAVVSNVPGAGSITLGGTRPSAADPHGHPSGLAVDYMVMSNAALGDAIVAYHVANWAELGVDYIIWEQRMLSSPGGSWKQMEDRGSVTANHFDHPHVNYR